MKLEPKISGINPTDKNDSHHWIFLRGLARSKEHWGPFVEIFRDQFPNDTVELLDAPGNGDLRDQKSFKSVSEYVHHFRARSKSEKPYSLLTISLGAMIGAEWARLFPEEVRELILINTSDSGSSSMFERFHPKQIPTALRLARAKENGVHYEKAIFQMTTGRLSEAEQDRWANEFAKLPLTSSANMLWQIFAASQYKFSKSPPKMPTLLISGLGDRLVSPVCTQRISEIWQKPLVSHPTAGHDLPLEEPAWLAETISSWLHRLRQSP